jgi:hypothetical protein
MKTTGIVVRTWNDAPISRRDSDGYADATAMCQANGREWKAYHRTDRTTDYITALADATGVAADQLVISTTTGPNHLRGTWIHPRLAVDLARWISPQFAVWMDGWFLDAVAAPSKPRHRSRLPRSPISAALLTSILPWCDRLASPQILPMLGLPVTRANQMALSTAMRSLGYSKARHMIDGQRHWIYSTPAAASSLPTRTTPLIGPRPTDAELASQLHEEASETLESIQFELELLNEPSTPPLVKAIAQEFNATAHRLTRLAAALTAVA